MARLRTPIRWIVNAVEVEEGQGLVEYALILTMIAIVVIGIITLIGTQTSTMYTSTLLPALEVP